MKLHTIRHFLFSFLLLSAILLVGCGSSSSGESQDPPISEEGRGDAVSVFPKTELALIGDTMPFYDNGTMNIFYLADIRDGKTGYHPWGLLTTTDYCTYEDAGIVIPYGESANDQDIALGTGCVIKGQDGKYHAFYTGHNDYRDPKEAVMHAVSDDMLNWTKIPADTFLANENYSREDFRDPYVLYVPEEQQYWMLIVTRAEGTGVIARYTSKDLSVWEDQGIFFEDDLGYGTNMECPTLISFGGKCYLSFSDQWSERVVHYRIADSMKGPFRKPEEDTIDGNGFYAGRLETDGTDLYMLGWNGTKIGHDDENDYGWAGNMVVHQLAQNSDGTLRAVPNRRVVEAMSRRMNTVPVRMTETVKADGSNYALSGDQYELIQFEGFDASGSITAEITDYADDTMFGFGFAPDIDNVTSLNYVFNVPENRIEFYNTDHLTGGDPQSFMNYDLKHGQPLHVTLFEDDGVVCMYINDEIALTSRMYRSNGTNWQFFGINSDVNLNDLAVYR